MRHFLLSLVTGTQVAAVLLAPSAALALTVPNIVPPRPTGVFGELVIQDYAAPARDLPSTIRFIINFVLGLLGILALAALVYGGFRYISSRGDEGEVETAKGIITNAIIGIVVIGIAAAIVNYIIGVVLTPTVGVGGVLPPPT